MKDLFKGLLIATAAMAAIVTVQMILSTIFTYHVGEVFSRISISALFYFAVFALIRHRKSAAIAE